MTLWVGLASAEVCPLGELHHPSVSSSVKRGRVQSLPARVAMRMGAAPSLCEQTLVLRTGSGTACISSEIPQALEFGICVALGK